MYGKSQAGKFLELCLISLMFNSLQAVIGNSTAVSLPFPSIVSPVGAYPANPAGILQAMVVPFFLDTVGLHLAPPIAVPLHAPAVPSADISHFALPVAPADVTAEILPGLANFFRAVVQTVSDSVSHFFAGSFTEAPASIADTIPLRTAALTQPVPAPPPFVSGVPRLPSDPLQALARDLSVRLAHTVAAHTGHTPEIRTLVLHSPDLLDTRLVRRMRALSLRDMTLTPWGNLTEVPMGDDESQKVLASIFSPLGALAVAIISGVTFNFI
jgi:hypothetical protein